VVISSISSDNAAGIELQTAFGFEFVGTLKEVGWKFFKWQDTNYYQLILD
jgi:L-amino acid N-acyltransferase